MEIIIGKICLAVFVASANYVIWRWRIDRGKSTPFILTICVCLLLKICMALLLHLTLGDSYLRSDPQSYFFKEFRSAYQGLLVYRDFNAVYNPLFCYFFGFFYYFFGPLGFIISFLFFEWLIYILVIRTFVGKNTFADRTAIFACLYFSPLSILYVLLEGQEDFLVLASFIMPLCCLPSAPFVSGLIFSLVFLCTKYLSAFSLPSILWYARRNVLKVAMGCLVIPVVYGMLALQGSDILVSFTQQTVEAKKTSGNVVFLVQQILGVASYTYLLYVSMAVLILIWISVSFLNRRKVSSGSEGVALLYILFWSSFMLLAPKTLGAYYLSFYPLFFILMAIREPRSIPHLIWIQIPLAVHHTIFYRSHNLSTSYGPGFNQVVQLLLSIILMAIAGYIFTKCLMYLRRLN